MLAGSPCRLGFFRERARSYSGLGFELAHQRQYTFAEIFHFFLEVQKARKHQVHPHGLECDDALGDLLRRADQVGLEAIVVLHQVLKAGLGPVALALRRRLACLPGRVTKGIDRLGVGLVDDLRQHPPRLFLRVAGDHKGVHAHLHRVVIGSGLGANIIDLSLNAFGRVAIGEIPIRHPRRHIPRRPRTAALENLRLAQGLGLEGVMVEAIEIALEGEIVLGPDAFEGTDKLFGTPIALIMLQPMLANGLELALEPATDNIHRNTAVGELVDGRQLLGRQRRLPRPRQDRRDDLEAGGCREQRMAERHGLMLVLGTIACGETNLRQAILKARRLRQLRQLAVVLDAPVGALFNLADHQPTADVGYPIGKFHSLLTHRTVPRTRDVQGIRQQACQG